MKNFHTEIGFLKTTIIDENLVFNLGSIKGKIRTMREE